MRLSPPRIPVHAALLSLFTVASCTFEIATSEVSCTTCADGGADGADGAMTTGGPGQAGPLPVATFLLSIPVGAQQNHVDVAVYGPGDTPNTLRRAGAPHPLVLFSPGQAIPREQYARLGAHLASHGLVAVVQSPRVEWNHGAYRDESAALLRWLIAPTGEGAERVRGLLDPAHVGVAGHGVGGKIAILLLARAAAPEPGDVPLRALFALDPMDSPGLGLPLSVTAAAALARLPAGVPLGLIGAVRPPGTPAGSCPDASGNYEAIYAAAPAPAFALALPQGGYGDFVDDPQSCTACRACPAGPAARSPRVTRDLSWKYLTAYFLWTLREQAAQSSYLIGPDFDADARLGLATRTSK